MSLYSGLCIFTLNIIQAIGKNKIFEVETWAINFISIIGIIVGSGFV